MMKTETDKEVLLSKTHIHTDRLGYNNYATRLHALTAYRKYLAHALKCTAYSILQFTHTHAHTQREREIQNCLIRGAL